MGEIMDRLNLGPHDFNTHQPRVGERVGDATSSSGRTVEAVNQTPVLNS
jgi:hypothetical protein